MDVSPKAQLARGSIDVSPCDPLSQNAPSLGNLQTWISGIRTFIYQHERSSEMKLRTQESSN